MSRKTQSATRKKQSSPSTKPLPAKKSGKTLWAVAAIAAVVVVGGIVLAGSTGKSSAAPPEEQKYIGRLLPANYVEPKVADNEIYSSAVKMSDVSPVLAGGQVSLPLAEVVSRKIVYFEYAKAGSQPIPMIAYVKPSGKLFVGVSFCPPCQGKRQRIEPDITLTCETCGTKRNLETGVGLSGSCKLYPLDELPAKVSGGNIVLQNSAIDSWTPQPKDRVIGGA